MPNPADSWLLMVIAIGGSVVVTLFWLQYSGVFSRIKNWTGNSADERTGELLSAYFSELQQKEQADPTEATPHLRPLRAIEQDGYIKCYIGNRGGTAFNLSVSPHGSLSATIEPADCLTKGKTGVISLKDLTASPLQEYQFTLSYTDTNRQKVSRQYYYDGRAGELKEI